MVESTPLSSIPTRIYSPITIEYNSCTNKWRLDITSKMESLDSGVQKGKYGLAVVVAVHMINV